MSNKAQAIALCRVSTPEQRLNNSLNRQEANVLKAATELGVEIVKWWSGDISSKAGTNLKRKDLIQIQDYCKKSRSVKYLIVDEPDRFMRSIDEAFYFEVLFREMGVTVWYASDSMLNTGDLNAKMLKFSKYFPAEGGNLERQTKSINGQTGALKEGRYPFHPKSGYMKGRRTAVQELHPERGPAFQKALKSIASGSRTPTRALIELNESAYTKTRAPLKMDKFRKYATDPYFAGITDIDKQVKYRNEFAQHEPMITKEEHKRILEVFSNKPKNQAGPRRNGNPKYPASNMFSHENCLDLKNCGRYVGLDLTNGKPSSAIYEKYRCRSCRRSLPMSYIHEQISSSFAQYYLSPDKRKKILKALEIVWQQNERTAEQEIFRLRHQINVLLRAKDDNVEAVANPDNFSIREDLLDAISKKKSEITKLEDKIAELENQKNEDKMEFMKFALDFVEDMGKHFLDSTVSLENRVRCKQLMFPAGILVNHKNKVYTPEVSIFYRGTAKKKSTEVLENSHLVRVKRL